jgi:predicted aspartyl protease/tetratricopeptide (TPR) repeat protein
MKIVRFCIAVAGMLFVASPTWAAECHLETYGSLQVDMIGEQPTTLVKINGTDMRFMLDTGAFYSTMSHADAETLGLKARALPLGIRFGGVGGAFTAQHTRIKEFGILGTTLRDVEFIVGGSDTGHGLIGANLLDIADLEIDLAHGKMALFKPVGCDKSELAYWSKNRYNVADIVDAGRGESGRQTIITVKVNDKKLRAMIDSGASATTLSRGAAEHIGIDVNGPDVKRGGPSIGFGSRAIKTWVVNIDSFAVGTELIQHTQMQVLDGPLGRDIDMLLGADFLLAHHMFIANSQGKVYFTYNGGRLFARAKPTSYSESAGSEKAVPLQNAADYALRGEANLSRGEPNQAVVDLNEAIRLAPAQSTYYFARARAQVALKQFNAAVADLDKSVSLDPGYVDALLMRARFRLGHRNIAGALADVSAASAHAPMGSPSSRIVAGMYIALDQPLAALPLLDGWIQIHPNDVGLGSALNERCRARSLSNQLLEDALSDCRKSIKRDGENPQYLDSLGMVELRLRNYPESIKAYEEASVKNSRLAWTPYGLGLAKIRSGQKDAGNADLAAARAIRPDIDVHAAKFGLTPAGP